MGNPKRQRTLQLAAWCQSLSMSLIIVSPGLQGLAGREAEVKFNNKTDWIMDQELSYARAAGAAHDPKYRIKIAKA